MREAVGGSFIFQIMIVFIFFFTAFIAIAINYSQAFRTKNDIINVIEQSEGYNETTRKRIYNLQSKNGYYRENLNCDSDFLTVQATDNSGTTKDIKGICIKQNAISTGAYYSVTTYVNFNIPIAGNLIAIPIKGETKLIVNDYYSP